jgi:5-methylcytosine-specific restriction endonuclease McrA
MSQLDRLTLVLNCAYEPVNVVSVKRALTLVHGGKAYVEVASGKFLKTAKLSIQIPSVIRLLVYRRVPRHNRAVSRKSILMRDRYTCQYCRQVFVPKQLTLDHVVPKSRGGGSTWENLVACCFRDNNKKGNRTPEEAGMTLAHKPAQIGIHGKHKLMMGSEDSAWAEYLYMENRTPQAVQ